MDRSWLRVAEKLVYHDPVSYLIELRRFEVKLAMSDTAPKLKALRTNGLRVAREQRQAAIFCHGMSERLGHKIYFASDEGQDYDFIASSLIEGARYYVPVQLKEVVSVEENPHSSIEAVISKSNKIY